MIIERLYIEGFGEFHDKDIHGFQKGFNLVYGSNEAGKSTLLDFIRFTLFGYPQLHKLRRPPLQGGNHGGRIWLYNVQNDKLILYRNGNRKDFEFEIHGQKSTDQQRYDQLIHHATTDLYQNIYAISLDELSNVGSLDASGMRDRIFSLGLGLSSANIGKIKEDLEKEGSDFFSKGGRTKVANLLSNSLHEKNKTINEISTHLDAYNQLAEEKEEKEKKYEEVKQKRESLDKEYHKIASLQRAYQPYVAYKTANNKLNDFTDWNNVPEEFLSEYSKQKENKERLEKVIKNIESNLGELERIKENIRYDSSLGEQPELLRFLNQNSVSLEDALKKKIVLNTKKQNAGLAIQKLMSQFGSDANKDQLLQIKGLQEIQIIAREISEKISELNNDKKVKTESQKLLSYELDELNKKKSIAEDTIAQSAINGEESKTKSEENISGLQARYDQSVNKPNLPSFAKWLVIAFILIMIGFGIYLLATVGLGIIPISLIAISIVFAVVFLTTGANNNNKISDTPQTLNQQINEIREHINRYAQQNNKLSEIKSAITEKQNLLNRNRIEINEIDNQLNQLQTQWQNFKIKNNLPSILQPNYVEGFIGNLNSLNNENQNNSLAIEELETIEKVEMQFQDKLKDFPEINHRDPVSIHSLIASLEDNINRKKEIEALEEKIKESNSQLKVSSSELQNINSRIQEIFAATGVDNEAAIYHHFDEQKIYKDAIRDKESNLKTLQVTLGLEAYQQRMKDLEEMSPDEIQSRLATSEQDLKDKQEEYDRLIREISELNTTMISLLNTGNLAKLRNEKNSIEEELKSGVKEWLSSQIALQVLSETKREYEKNHQPRVLSKAGEYFKTATENRYKSITISSDSNDISIRDTIGNPKTIEQLSRGTKEQLLLSLRLGLIEEYEENAEPLPVILDDIMVNFDRERTNQFADLLIGFAKQRQVIYFTCHEHLRDLFAAKGVNVVGME